MVRRCWTGSLAFRVCDKGRLAGIQERYTEFEVDSHFWRISLRSIRPTGCYPFPERARSAAENTLRSGSADAVFRCVLEQPRLVSSRLVNSPQPSNIHGPFPPPAHASSLLEVLRRNHALHEGIAASPLEILLGKHAWNIFGENQMRLTPRFSHASMRPTAADQPRKNP